MDWSRIVWGKIFETRLWALINLALPVCIIPIAAVTYWFRNMTVPWMRIVREGQFCFYAVVILAASGYEIVAHWEQPHVAGMTPAIIFVGFWAVLFFGLIFADGDGTANHPRQFNDSKVANVSVIIAVTAAFLAWVAHAVTEGAYK